MHSTTELPIVEPAAIDERSYVLLGQIGKGGMADVYLALRRGVAGFEKLVVVKLIRSTFRGQPLLCEMFNNEARLAARLNHPNIVQVIDFGIMNGLPFLAMEYVAGQSLHEISMRCAGRQALLPLGVGCRIISTTLAGLHHAHTRAQPIIHRDVSATNIMVSYSGGVKLLDFGIAKSLTQTGDESELTRPGQWKGRFPYMSPEQIRHEALDARSDVFTVGVILWELLTGRRLFRRATELESMRAVCIGDVPAVSTLNPKVPPNLSAVVSRALSVRREDRFPSAEEMQDAIEEIIWRRSWRADPLRVQRLMKMLFADGERLTEEGYRRSHVATPKLAVVDVFEEDRPTALRIPRLRPVPPTFAAGSDPQQATLVVSVEGDLSTGGRRRIPLKLILIAVVVFVLAVVVGHSAS